MAGFDNNGQDMARSFSKDDPVNNDPSSHDSYCSVALTLHSAHGKW